MSVDAETVAERFVVLAPRLKRFALEGGNVADQALKRAIKCVNVQRSNYR